MGTPYDYITLVQKPEWALVGIVPHDTTPEFTAPQRPIIEPILPPKITEAVVVGPPAIPQMVPPALKLRPRTMPPQ